MAAKQRKFDRMSTGLLIGLAIPLVVFYITYQVKYSDIDFVLFLKGMWRMKIFLKLLSVCVFPNLGIFLLFYRMKYDLAARGVILATFIFAFSVLAGKLI